MLRAKSAYDRMLEIYGSIISLFLGLIIFGFGITLAAPSPRQEGAESLCEYATEAYGAMISYEISSILSALISFLLAVFIRFYLVKVDDRDRFYLGQDRLGLGLRITMGASFLILGFGYSLCPFSLIAVLVLQVGIPCIKLHMIHWGFLVFQSTVVLLIMIPVFLWLPWACVFARDTRFLLDDHMREE